jgi:tRNA-dihydrouridine synthase
VIHLLSIVHFVARGEWRTSQLQWTCLRLTWLLLWLQLAGHDADLLIQCAELVQDNCDAVDINLGCPQVVQLA